MGELVDRDQEHLRLIEIGFYVQAGMAAFISLFMSIYVFIGILALSVHLPQTGPNDPPLPLLGWIFIAIGGFAFLLGMGFAGLLFYAARGVKQRKHRTLAMVLAGFCCLQMPYGTVFGVLAIMVLNRLSVIPLFEHPPAVPPALH